MRLEVRTEEDAWQFVEQLRDAPDLWAEQWEDDDVEIEIGEWARILVYAPNPPKDSSITPPIMSAFIEAQNGLFRLAAYAKYEQADIRKLTFEDRHKYQVVVVVQGGSSQSTLDLSEVAKHFISETVGKMSPKAVAFTVVAIALIFGGHLSWNVYLEKQKEVRLAEIDAEERRANLEAMHFADEQETQRLQLLTDLLTQHEFGRRISETGDHLNDELLRGATSLDEAIIRGRDITRNEAQELRKSARGAARTQIITRQLRVIDVNTSDPIRISAVFHDSETGEDMRAHFEDAILADENREALFRALRERDEVWVKMKVRYVRGEVRSTELMRVSEQEFN